MPPNNDEIRFEAIVRDHLDAVLRYAARRVPERAEDVAAETFVVAWRRLRDIPGEPRAWLLGISRNLILNETRGARRRLALWQKAAHEPTPANTLLVSTGLDPELVAAVLALPASEREALLLIAWDGLTPTQAAEAVGCSRAAFSMRLSRARRSVTAALSQPLPLTQEPT